MWPYSYDSCDLGTFPNQTAADGTPPEAKTGGNGGGPLSYLPGQKASACSVSDFHLAWRVYLSVPRSSALDQITPALQSTRDVTRQKSISLRPKSTQRIAEAKFHSRSKSPPSTTSTSSIRTPLPRRFSTLRTPRSTRTRVQCFNRLSLAYPISAAKTTTIRPTPPMGTSTGRSPHTGRTDISLGFRRANKLGRSLQRQLARTVPPGSKKGSSQRNLW